MASSLNSKMLPADKHVRCNGAVAVVGGQAKNASALQMGSISPMMVPPQAKSILLERVIPKACDLND